MRGKFSPVVEAIKWPFHETASVLSAFYLSHAFNYVVSLKAFNYVVSLKAFNYVVSLKAFNYVVLLKGFLMWYSYIMTY